MRVGFVNSDKATPAGGHYAQATVAAGLIFVSGQLGITGGESPNRPVSEQAKRVLNSLAAILQATGANLSDVAKVTIYVRDVADWPVIDTIYARFFGSHKPARAIVPVPELHFDAALELEAIALAPVNSQTQALLIKH